MARTTFCSAAAFLGVEKDIKNGRERARAPEMFKIIIKNVCRLPKQGHHSTVVGFRVALLLTETRIFHSYFGIIIAESAGDRSLCPIWRRGWAIFFFSFLDIVIIGGFAYCYLKMMTIGWRQKKEKGKPFNLGKRHTGEYQKANWVYEKLYVHRAGFRGLRLFFSRWGISNSPERYVWPVFFKENFAWTFSCLIIPFTLY